MREVERNVSWALHPNPRWKSERRQRDFPGGPVVKTPCFHCRRHGFDLSFGLIPGWGTKIPHAASQGQKKKEERKEAEKKTQPL